MQWNIVRWDITVNNGYRRLSKVMYGFPNIVKWDITVNNSYRRLSKVIEGNVRFSKYYQVTISRYKTFNTGLSRFEIYNQVVPNKNHATPIQGNIETVCKLRVIAL